MPPSRWASTPSHGTYLLSSLCVLGVAGLLLILHRTLPQFFPVLSKTPLPSFALCFCLPVAFLTALGGRRVGLFTLAFSLLCADCFLTAPWSFTAPRFAWAATDPRDRVEMCLLALCGALLILLVSRLRAALRRLSDDLNRERIEAQIRATAVRVPGVLRFRSCQTQQDGLDYHVSLTVETGLPESAYRALADQLGQAVRAENPFIFLDKIVVGTYSAL